MRKPSPTARASASVLVFALCCVAVFASPRTRPLRAEPPAAARPAAAPASIDPSLLARLEQIDARAARIKDLTASFRQEKTTALLKEPLISSGTVRVKGSINRWDTEKPERAVLFADGKEVRLYYPKQAALEVYPLDRRLSEMAASPLPRLATLRRLFAIEHAPLKDVAPDGDEAKLIALRLTPIDESLREHVSLVRVLLDVNSSYILRLETVDADGDDGDRTVIRFTDIKVDTGLSDEDLDLRVPAGTSVSRPLDGAGGGPGRGSGKD